MPGAESPRAGLRTTHARARRALSERLRSLARRKRGDSNSVGSSCERATQVILGIGMASRELGTGQTENRFHPRCGHTLQEQFFGDPEIRDTPIGPRKALRNLEATQPDLIDRGSFVGRESRVEQCVRRWGGTLKNRRLRRHTGQRVPLRQMQFAASAGSVCRSFKTEPPPASALR